MRLLKLASAPGLRSGSVWLSAGVLALLAAAVAVMSLAVVWLGDDVDYRYFIHRSIWDSNGSFHSVGQFFASQANHYWYVNGRTVAHVFVQLFCGVLGQTAFAVCNALVYPLFVFLLARLAGVAHPMRQPMALAGIASLALLTFVTKMMPSTQIGFVWMFALVLGWLLVFRCIRRAGWWLRILLLLFSILAGNSQEALTIGVSAALGLWWLSRRCRVGTARMWMLAGFWAGTLACCLSPGTLHRADATVIPFADSLLYMAMSLRATWLLAVVAVWLVVGHRTSWRRIWRRGALPLLALAVLIIFNLVIGVYSNRQLFGAELMALVIIFRILPSHRFPLVPTVLFAAAAVAMVSVQTVGALDVRRQYSEMADLYLESRDNHVYYNRRLASTNIFMREFRIYEEVVGRNNHDTRHSLQKDFAVRVKPRKRWPWIQPAVTAGRDFSRDTVIQYAPQQYVVVLADSTSRVVETLRNPLMGAVTRREVEFARPVKIGRGWKAYLAVPQIPFRETLSIEILPR